MHSQFKANKDGLKQARSQRRFDLFILFITFILWTYIIKAFADSLFI